MERSVPARTIRPAHPRARIPFVEAFCRIFKMLFILRKSILMIETTTRIKPMIMNRA